MIQRFVDKFMTQKESIAEGFRLSFPDDYMEIVKAVVRTLDDDELDPERIHLIDDGDYQGTLVFVIGTRGYQPSDYHYVKVSYGSCSGCDTLEAIKMECPWADDGRAASDGQIYDLMTLALHVVQNLRRME